MKNIENILLKFKSENGYNLNIGSGYYIQHNYIGIDNGDGFAQQIPENGRSPDIFMDLCKEKWPFEDKSCNEVYSSHSFEHFPNTDFILNEAHRVLKSDRLFKIIVPYANSAEGMYPGHNIFFTEKWFQNNLTVNKLFDIIYIDYTPTNEYKNIPEDHPIKKIFTFDLARQFLFNACNQMEIHLKKKI